MTETADASVSTSTAEPILAAEGEIPLPPREMFGELDNSKGRVEASDAPASPSARHRIAPAVAALEFVGEKKPRVEIPLAYPFRWNGVVVETIVVRRLTVAEVGAFWDGLPDDGSYERSDLYGVMCGLPGEVIRALPDVDGLRVTEVCFDFLPRVFGGASD
jgi:hypothetical protein